MSELTHERCSELLEAYASGRLELRAREQVDMHLATCPDCSLELVAVEALRGPEILPMSGTERDVLSKGVRSAIFSPAKASFSERFGRRFAPAVGAVALLALAAVALVSLPRGADEPASAPQVSNEADGGGDLQENATVEADRAAAPKEEPETLSGQDTASSGGQGAGSGAAGGAPAPAAADTSAAVTAGSAALNARANFVVQEETFAETGLERGSLVPAISPGRRFDGFSKAGSALAAGAPTPRLEELTRECTDQTIATSPHRLVPTSAAYFPDDVLVIGFVWLEESSSLLNYELRGWVGGRCDRISPIYRRGFLE